MNVVEKALSEGISPYRLVIAAHEMGHAMGWHHSGIPVKQMIVKAGWRREVKKAYCESAMRCSEGTVDEFIVGATGGFIASLRFFVTYLNYPMARATVDATDMAIHDFAQVERITRRFKPSLNWDIGELRSMKIINKYDRELDHWTVQLARKSKLSGKVL